jgi:hypothetical protein
MKPETAEYLAIIKSVRKLIEEESKLVSEVVIMRIKANSSPELLKSNIASPYERTMDLMDVEAIIEHIFDMGRLDAYKLLYQELTKTINSIEYEDKISQ